MQITFQIYEREAACNESVKHVSCTLRTKYTNSTLLGLIYEEENSTMKFCSHSADSVQCAENLTYSLQCEEDIETVTDCIYKTAHFWTFVLFMSIGTIGFNVVNSISDAICFDVIGEYGHTKFCHKPCCLISRR